MSEEKKLWKLNRKQKTIHCELCNKWHPEDSNVLKRHRELYVQRQFKPTLGEVAEFKVKEK